ncbi:Retrovirus-related Pol polyprotein from transposon [Trichinella papuae]|uniref:Retrovirus-related Pol polyprotein from transposon n=1 Tax=Trichinella papuae TaxID=268474 RepID=A0A0V1MEH9_9BILA|nr:Retrovirus-related Pol polyprotein from transposon [Trichinella papuae]
MTQYLVNKDKCILAVPSLPFLGHTVDANGFDRYWTKCKQSKPSWHPKPDVSSADFSACRSIDEDHPGTWATNCINATKDALANAMMLHYSHLTAEYILMCSPPGACEELLAALAFFSKRLTATRKRYSAFERELLAAYLAAKHFCHAVEGRRFMVYTDHKPLTHAFPRPSNNLNDLVLKQPPGLIIPIKATPLEI